MQLILYRNSIDYRGRNMIAIQNVANIMLKLFLLQSQWKFKLDDHIMLKPLAMFLHLHHKRIKKKKKTAQKCTEGQVTKKESSKEDS